MFCPKRIPLRLAGLLLLANFSCTAPAPPVSESRRPRTVDLKPCGSATHRPPALCAKLAVYENRAAKSGRMIALNILLLPALVVQANADPVFFLYGGPGQGAATLAAAGADSLMRQLRRERDLVFVDLRGTGESNPLRCPSSAQRAMATSDVGELFDAALVRACRAALAAVAELKFYTTALAVDDLDDVRAALGYDKINLYAVSYGTLAAFDYMRRFPEHVRAVALAAVVTPGAKLPIELTSGAAAALDALFADCAADPACARQYGNLTDDFAALLAGFASGPVTFKVSDPLGKTPQTVALSRGAFAERLRLMLYSHETARLIPWLIHSAVKGDWAPFNRVAATGVRNLSFSAALGAYLSVTCSESLPALSEAEISRQSEKPFPGDYRIRRHQQACALWPRGEVAPGFHEPVRSNLPVLMLSGEIDPATPPRLAHETLHYLTNGRQIILRNTPHSYTSSCARRLTVEFIAKASVNGLDSGCAARLRRPPFSSLK